jgi:hypothetical protein
MYKNLLRYAQTFERVPLFHDQMELQLDSYKDLRDMTLRNMIDMMHCLLKQYSTGIATKPLIHTGRADLI